MSREKVSTKGHKTGKRLTYRDLKHRYKRKTTKLNTQQIDMLSEKAADAVMIQSDVFAKSDIINLSLKKNKKEIKIILEEYLKEYLSFPSNQFISLNSKIERPVAKCKSETSKDESAPTSIIPDWSSLIDISDDLIKSLKLERSQIKNLFKRLLLGLRKKHEKTRSAFQALIKFIITPRLFGIYVSEEDSNEVAVFSFSNC